MGKTSNEKLKTLYVLKILREETNEQHALTASQIAARLNGAGIPAERKSVYRDIDALEDFGYDIVRGHSGFFLGERELETAELKLLSDAVLSSRFITEKKSRELIEKLFSMTDRYSAASLRGGTFINDRPKTDNESIYYTVDSIHTAISQNKMIAFHYFDWNAQKKQVLRRGGALYCVSPWGLIRDDEKYYLIAYDGEAGIIKHFRTDKMLHTEMLDSQRQGEDTFKGLDLSMYSKRIFGMYSGEECTVTLHCDAGLAGVVIDRFGSDVSIYPTSGGTFSAAVRVQVSNSFFSWVLQFGRKMKIAAPADVRERMRRLIDEAGELYR